MREGCNYRLTRIRVPDYVICDCVFFGGVWAREGICLVKWKENDRAVRGWDIWTWRWSSGRKGEKMIKVGGYVWKASTCV